MQSLMHDVRTVRRWVRTESDQEDGDCVAVFTRGGVYRLSFRPTQSSKEDSEQGTIHRTGHRIYANDTHDFLQGDRIGDDTGPTMEVVTVIDNTTGQIMEVSDL